MSVESSKTRRGQQSDIGDLQAEYTQKKKKYARQQETELDDMKEFYNARKEETREQGEAAINHIRKKQAANLETVTETRQKLTERGEAQLGSIDANYRKKVVETQSRRQAQVDAARHNTEEKVNEILETQSQKVEKVRTDSNQQIQGTKEKFKKDLGETQAYTSKRLEDAKTSNQRLMETEIAKGRISQDKLHENQKKDYAQVNAQGQKVIETRKEVQENHLKRQDHEYGKRIEKNKEKWVDREVGQNEQYTNRLGLSKKAYEQQIKDQHKRFESTYDKNEKANRDSLRIQNGNYLKEQVELKKKFFQSSEKYAGKEDDPFYKLQDRGNRLRENSDFYIIEAYVPQHEKDSVRVVIKDDVASVTGKRAFKDEIEEEGRRLTTNSYQSFREQFNFDKPVITEGMTRERDGDYVTFWVPKLNSFEGVRKLNKKA